MQNQIRLNEQWLPVKFNYEAIKCYEKLTDESYLNIINQIAGGQPKVANIIALAYAGLIGAGYNLKSIDTIAEWVMKMNQEDLTALYRIFLESFPKPENGSVETKEEAALEAAKK